ncbi:MAG: 50S ribosomal protein L29 [Nitrososphaerota archaeon]|nr:50S ribosomal protein L29 [Nitrososphaerales archaeon]MCX8191311.1 50S ribosomal protein L29 [Nitrososphaerales archaeon]MDW8044296.1 50S ribosomal protein L29 [Nitrososphaerota archaeon]
MTSLKASELRKMSKEELNKKLSELTAELMKLKSSAARGTLRKETGKIKYLRRDIARIKTVLNEMRKKVV